MNIYLHIEEPTEPAGDGSVLKEVFDDSETEYSGLGQIKFFTSEAGFFTKNQDLSDTWTINFNCKYANKTSGYAPYIRFYFYKRDEDDNDTLLFSTAKFESFTTLYSSTGYSMNVTASGTVATIDRLRILVYMSEALPH